jgi:hypothetical protein
MYVHHFFFVWVGYSSDLFETKWGCCWFVLHRRVLVALLNRTPGIQRKFDLRCRFFWGC